MRNDCSFLKRDFAHRGLHDDDTPENSMAAFKKTVDAGFGIELDVQLTKDRQIVVVHDPGLKRLCNADMNVRTCDYADIAGLSILDSDQHIPLLDDVLALVDGAVPLLIELKDNGSKDDIVAHVLDAVASYGGECALQSFNNRFVGRAKRRSKDTKVPCGLLLPYFKGMFSHAMGYFVTVFHSMYSSPDFYSFHVSMPGATVQRLGKRRVKLGWTVESQHDHDEFCGIFDGLIFEGFIPAGVR